MNLLSSKEEVDDLRKELRDRFGKPSQRLEKLFDVLYLKVKARQAGVRSIKEEEGKINIEWLSGKRKKVEVKVRDKIKLAERGIAG